MYYKAGKLGVCNRLKYCMQSVQNVFVCTPFMLLHIARGRTRDMRTSFFCIAKKRSQKKATHRVPSEFPALLRAVAEVGSINLRG